MDEPLIRYKNVNINQQELGVLEDVNLELNKGEFVYLIGKVGSGKTSLLKTIYGELDIQSGDAEVLGYNIISNISSTFCKCCCISINVKWINCTKF